MGHDERRRVSSCCCVSPCQARFAALPAAAPDQWYRVREYRERDRERKGDGSIDVVGVCCCCVSHTLRSTQVKQIENLSPRQTIDDDFWCHSKFIFYTCHRVESVTKGRHRWQRWLWLWSAFNHSQIDFNCLKITDHNAKDNFCPAVPKSRAKTPFPPTPSLTYHTITIVPYTYLYIFTAMPYFSCKPIQFQSEFTRKCRHKQHECSKSLAHSWSTEWRYVSNWQRSKRGRH